MSSACVDAWHVLVLHVPISSISQLEFCFVDHPCSLHFLFSKTSSFCILFPEHHQFLFLSVCVSPMTKVNQVPSIQTESVCWCVCVSDHVHAHAGWFMSACLHPDPQPCPLPLHPGVGRGGIVTRLIVEFAVGSRGWVEVHVVASGLEAEVQGAVCGGRGALVRLVLIITFLKICSWRSLEGRVGLWRITLSGHLIATGQKWIM